MDNKLTEFQKDCLERLECELASVNRELEGLESRRDHPALAGETSQYLYARVSGTPVEVWIYDDQADVTSSGSTTVFESIDYRSLDELTSAFLKTILEQIPPVSPAEPSQA